MRKKQKNKNWKYPMIVFLLFFAVLTVLFVRYAYLALSKSVNGHDIQKFAANRNTVSETLTASRGTIFDKGGGILAQNVSSYSLIAYLDPSRKNGSKIDYVKDLDNTANQIGRILNVDPNKLKQKMENGQKNKRYQIEFGNLANDVSEIQKGEIEDLNLPGIDFNLNYKRFYPNGDFASYIIGYAKTNEKQENGKTIKEIQGEMGVESKYNDILKGTDGYLKYQRDRMGYKIPDTKEIRIDAINGNNIYLTIDSSIQRFVETETKKLQDQYKPEWSLITVMDAKTGDILASSQTPSFNPNKRDVQNYENLLVSNAFEPGSTMKTYTYMCAIDKGVYNGNETFNSGSITLYDATIKDWNLTGWGTITFDKGYEYSSNVGVTNLIEKYLSRKELKDCFTKYGFGKQTGIELSREASGKLGFTYPVEVANAGFGQGINTTAIQQLQGLTIIANNGKMLKPHVISKIVNPNNNKTTYKRKIEESEQLVKTSTTDKMKDLMYNVVNGTDPGTSGKRYHIDGFDVIGKTGTAQIASNRGGYEKGSNAYIYSFAGMFPKDNPEIIVYAAIKKPNVGSSIMLSDALTSLFKNIAKYKNMFTIKTNKSNIASLKLDSFTNKKTNDVKRMLLTNNINPIIIGDGDKIISQYPAKGSRVLSYDKVILVTNGKQNIMPNIIGYSRSEAIYLMKALNYNYQIEGYGYVTAQSIPPNEDMTNKSVNITLSQKYDDVKN